MDAEERVRLRAELQAGPILGDGDRLIPPCLKALDALEAAEAARWLDKGAKEREEADNAWAAAAQLREVVARLTDPQLLDEHDGCPYCGGDMIAVGPVDADGDPIGGTWTVEHLPGCVWPDARAALAATEPEAPDARP